MRFLIIVSMLLILGLFGTSFGDQKDNIEGFYKGKPGRLGEANHICIVKNPKDSYTVMISTIYCPSFPISDCSNGKCATRLHMRWGKVPRSRLAGAGFKPP